MSTIKKIAVIIIFAVSVVFLGVKVSTANENSENTNDLINTAETEINKTIAIDVIKKGTMVASWYGPKFNGKQTANTEVFNQLAYTAAHKTLPFGTMLKVTNPSNGKSIIVRINDRGPYIKGRDIDLSKGAATALGMVQKGVIKVEVEKLVPRLSNS